MKTSDNKNLKTENKLFQCGIYFQKNSNFICVVSLSSAVLLAIWMNSISEYELFVVWVRSSSAILFVIRLNSWRALESELYLGKGPILVTHSTGDG
jgi:hypothetical protein